MPGAQMQRCERAGGSRHQELGANEAEATEYQRKQNRSLSAFGGRRILAGFSQRVSRDVSKPAKTTEPSPAQMSADL